MEEGEVERAGLPEVDERGLEEGVVRAVLRPAAVPLGDIGPVQFIAPGAELPPLEAGIEHVEDVIEDLVQGKFGDGPLDRSLEMRLDGLVEIPARDLLGERIPAELGVLMADFGTGALPPAPGCPRILYLLTDGR